ncbi:GGDEF domain-containing protein [Thalassospira sp.]|uniref:GGDEF domain-containing protein n=1 Tax=Thalassospira sp. TaxID=1912094 RepID=UPI002736FB99|nr:diguanylate cyclase [Thalassospira sp.]MDP2697464.1 diguanylate cyclase [Thalassospira sp.]
MSASRDHNNQKPRNLSAMKLGSSIATRHLLMAFMIAFGLGLSISCVQIWLDYRWLHTVYQQNNDRVISASMPVAARALSQKDADLVNAVMAGVLTQRSFIRARLVDREGSVPGEQISPFYELHESFWDDVLFGGPVTHRFILDAPAPGNLPPVGHLEVDLNPHSFVVAFFQRVRVIVSGALIYAFVVTICFVAMTFRTVTRPILQLTDYMVQSDPTDMKRPLAPPPQYRHDDELQVLGAVTAGLFALIRRQIGELQAARDDLQQANQSLEVRVEQRTRELNEAMAKLEQLAATDPLTGLANRRTLLMRLEGAISVWKRRHVPVSLVLLDLDHFKKLNDQYGHRAGDQVLMSLSRVLREGLRDIDLPARIGGEEFAVMLPGEGAEGAMIVAERLRMAIEEDEVVCDAAKMHYTASFGVASLSAQPHGTERAENTETLIDALYGRADRALYQAKERGRNRCVQAQG